MLTCILSGCVALCCVLCVCVCVIDSRMRLIQQVTQTKYPNGLRKRIMQRRSPGRVRQQMIQRHYHTYATHCPNTMCETECIGSLSQRFAGIILFLFLLFCYWKQVLFLDTAALVSLFFFLFSLMFALVQAAGWLGSWLAGWLVGRI